MAMITGGLGGLGVLACYELAASGQPYICTTSRSGRIGGGQRELVQMQENFRQMCTHYTARIDGSDAAAINDLFQWVQRPEEQGEEFDLFNTCLASIDKNPELLGADEIQKLASTKEHINATMMMLDAEIKEKGGTSKDEWLLREITKRNNRLGEVLGKVYYVAQQRGVSVGENAEVPAKEKATLKDFMKKKQQETARQSTTVLEKVDEEIAAAGAA
mmetsp:Transcript_1235/g.4180  ORF Transcript_1235/g.4180 Transcript_1235/m.4180 type:complete len:217 (+) Transcript_1235:88-738(+)|eukprot:CAMPEP_0204528862 /NCGR_PEP_ID=MMETSP0661-20131031/9751_1 /ASSEMBLY_ACC=CAM_ASM_000606 /TAXON_ID=109239 /ORGANISM="Alexandrium margalefi, Strain AMGDE01CS-322" /LENGTH=216 /DNA_ID=CAMNT_0051534859 /DNA_START=87 /DNA_END=737 /DNA_ORIENTATION=+